ncbi:MAG: STAS domain-containing protein [Mariprofundaceae bacterium]|nr:STAS domain-containing protein [Mariprofundaceae bacterium]
MKLEIDEKQGENASRLTLSGVVNIHTAVQLRQRIKPMLNDGNREIHIDLNAVKFIDSAGLATLIEGLQWSRAGENRRFVLSGLNENVRDIFELAKLDTIFEIEDGKIA